MLSAGRWGRKAVTKFQSVIYSVCDYHMPRVSAGNLCRLM